MSASLPGVSVPHLSSRPAQAAPPAVAHSSTWRTLTSADALASPLTLRYVAIARCTLKATRISVNMSVPYDTSLSMLKPGRMPWSSAFWNAETPSPSPYCASDLGQTFTVAPASLTRCHTWSGHP